MLSTAHLIIIFLVALMVFGPEKLPELARNLGKVMGQITRATNDLRAGFDEHMRELEREAQALDFRKPPPSPANTIHNPERPKPAELPPAASDAQISAVTASAPPMVAGSSAEPAHESNPQKDIDGQPKPV